MVVNDESAGRVYMVVREAWDPEDSLWYEGTRTRVRAETAQEAMRMYLRLAAQSADLDECRIVVYGTNNDGIWQPFWRVTFERFPMGASWLDEGAGDGGDS